MLIKKNQNSAPSWSAITVEKLEEQRKNLRLKIKGAFHEYNSRSDNSVANRFKTAYDFHKSTYVHDYVLSRYSMFLNAKKFLSKIEEELLLHEGEDTSEVRSLMSLIEKDLTLVEEFLKDVVTYSNVEPLKNNGGFIISYNKVFEAWDTFFSKWKVECDFLNCAEPVYFEKGKYFDVDSKYFSTGNEMQNWRERYMAIANPLRTQGLDSKQFTIETASCTLCKYISSVKKCICASAVNFPEKW